jgi:hypothetical protein
MNDRDIEDTRQPPDEPEAKFCESCGEELDEESCSFLGNYWKCPNPFCPTQFQAHNNPQVVMEMAVKLVEVLEENHILKARNNYLELAMERKWNATKK